MKIITEQQIRNLEISPCTCVDWVKECFLFKNDAQLPAKLSIHFNENNFFNTMPFERDEVVEVVFDTPKGSAAKVDIGVDGASQGDQFYDIVDENGNKTEYKELYNDDISIGVEREMDTKAIKFNANRKRVLVHVKVPQFGYKSYALRFRKPEFAFHPEIMENRKLIARENGILENEFLKVSINSNGTINLLDKENNRLMENMMYYTDTGETGSAHISTQPKRNVTYTSLGCSSKITMLESNELRGSFKIDLTLLIPAAATVSGDDRSREMKELPISTILTLEKNSKSLKVKTTLTNECRDHKLIVNFPSNLPNADWVDVESAWDVAHRTIKWRDHKDNFEAFTPFQPMQNFVDVSDNKYGLAILTKGLREYEIADDTLRTIKITLIRTQRAYMTANSKMNVEELDKYTGQHSFGKITYEYSIYPHKGNYQEGLVLRKAYDDKVPLKAIQGVVMDGILNDCDSFISTNQQNKVYLSGIKESEDKQGIIVRLWNSTDETLPLKVKTILPIKGVSSVRLDETFVSDIIVSDNSFEIEMKPHKIETFLLKL